MAGCSDSGRWRLRYSGAGRGVGEDSRGQGATLPAGENAGPLMESQLSLLSIFKYCCFCFTYLISDMNIQSQLAQSSLNPTLVSLVWT